MKSKVFKIVTWIGSIYHILLGLIGTFASSDTIYSIVNSVYGVNPTQGAEFIVFAKFISVYMIAFGIMLGILAYNPTRYKILVWPAVILFGIRIVERTVFFGLIAEAFQITTPQNMKTVVTITIMALLLLLLRPKTSQSN